VIVNLGSNDGIQDESVFSILGEPEPVIDPFTSEELGLVSVVKAKVKAYQVHDKFTIASTKWFSTYFKPTANLGAQIGSLFDTQVVDQGELRVNPSDIQPWRAKSEIPVRIGDVVEVEVPERSIASIENAESSPECKPLLPDPQNENNQDP
jgi:hypothetical protein